MPDYRRRPVMFYMKKKKGDGGGSQPIEENGVVYEFPCIGSTTFVNLPWKMINFCYPLATGGSYKKNRATQSILHYLSRILIWGAPTSQSSPVWRGSVTILDIKSDITVDMTAKKIYRLLQGTANKLTGTNRQHWSIHAENVTIASTTKRITYATLDSTNIAALQNNAAISQLNAGFFIACAATGRTPITNENVVDYCNTYHYNSSLGLWDITNVEDLDIS